MIYLFIGRLDSCLVFRKVVFVNEVSGTFRERRVVRIHRLHLLAMMEVPIQTVEECIQISEIGLFSRLSKYQVPEHSRILV